MKNANSQLTFREVIEESVSTRRKVQSQLARKPYATVVCSAVCRVTTHNDVRSSYDICGYVFTYEACVKESLSVQVNLQNSNDSEAELDKVSGPESSFSPVKTSEGRTELLTLLNAEKIRKTASDPKSSSDRRRCVYFRSSIPHCVRRQMRKFPVERFARSRLSINT